MSPRYYINEARSYIIVRKQYRTSYDQVEVDAYDSTSRGGWNCNTVYHQEYLLLRSSIRSFACRCVSLNTGAARGFALEIPVASEICSASPIVPQSGPPWTPRSSFVCISNYFSSRQPSRLPNHPADSRTEIERRRHQITRCVDDPGWCQESGHTHKTRT